MKKILFAIALTITLSLTASAQFNDTDGFFNNSWGENNRYDSGDGFSFVLPSLHGFGEDTPSSPLGSGLVILGALGAGYAVARKRKSM